MGQRLFALATTVVTLSAACGGNLTPAAGAQSEGQTIKGTGGADVLIGTSGDDVIYGFGGNDTIKGKGGNDTIIGGKGADVLKGAGGDDTLKGGKGEDTLKGGKGEDHCDGGRGTNSFSGCEDSSDDSGGSGDDSEDSEVDLTSLMLGDGHVTTSAEKGSVFSCTTRFGQAGASADGPWLNGDGTWDLTKKVEVDGAVSWPSDVTIITGASTRTIDGNGLPDHPTGNYPISSDDDAYAYDRNPNSISAQSLHLQLPLWPEVASSPTCTSLGSIGILLTGAPFFNALDGGGSDAVAHEVQDSCQGHPEMSGQYHYHSVTSCLEDDGTGHSELVGYALDGFGIYGHRGESGEELTNDNLDACHGHTHQIEWNGEMVEMYHYHATWEYPYTVGCYRGTPVT